MRWQILGAHSLQLVNVLRLKVPTRPQDRRYDHALKMPVAITDTPAAVVTFHAPVAEIASMAIEYTPTTVAAGTITIDVEPSIKVTVLVAAVVTFTISLCT